jgi:hypothetical protein
VQGYNIWKHSFMKNLLIDEMIINWSNANIKWKTPLNAKKYSIDFFLPKFGLSTKYKDRKKLGAYPKIVKIYELNDLWSLPKINGRTVNWP